MDRRLVVSAIEPAIAIEKTEPMRGRWVTSGKVSLRIYRGDEFELGSLAIPFHDADSRESAYEQAIETIESIIARLSDVARSFRDSQQGSGRSDQAQTDA